LQKGKIITYIVGIIAFLLPITLYFTPPTDFDGGPMMAYNFLYFYPVAFLSFILSIIVVIRLNLFKNDLISKALLAVSVMPTLILTALILMNMYRISNEPPYYLDLELHNNTVNLIVNDSLEVDLHGFTKKQLNMNDEIIEVKKINLVPHINKKFSYKDGGSFIGESGNQEVYYKLKNDSLLIYSVGVEFSFFNTAAITASCARWY
jgi:hypothetical protein